MMLHERCTCYHFTPCCYVTDCLRSFFRQRAHWTLTGVVDAGYNHACTQNLVLCCHDQSLIQFLLEVTASHLVYRVTFLMDSPSLSISLNSGSNWNCESHQSAGVQKLLLQLSHWGGFLPSLAGVRESSHSQQQKTKNDTIYLKLQHLPWAIWWLLLHSMCIFEFAIFSILIYTLLVILSICILHWVLPLDLFLDLGCCCNDAISIQNQRKEFIFFIWGKWGYMS